MCSGILWTSHTSVSQRLHPMHRREVFMRLVSLPPTVRSSVCRGAPWLALLLLLQVAIAQEQMPPRNVEPEETPTAVSPAARSLPAAIEPLRERFFPPI